MVLELETPSRWPVVNINILRVNDVTAKNCVNKSKRVNIQAL